MRMRRPISRRATVAKELIKTGYTAQAVTSFRGRSGRSFRAHLALQQTDEGNWRVEFDEGARQSPRGRGGGSHGLRPRRQWQAARGFPPPRRRILVISIF